MHLKSIIYYFLAALGSACVTYILPGTTEEEAFVDIMGILLSLVFLVFGIFYAVIQAIINTEGKVR